MTRFGCLAIAMAVMAAGSASAQISETKSSSPSEQESRVVLRAERLTDDRENRQLIAEGNVEARFDTRTLRADRVIYDLEKETIRAQGRVEITDADGVKQYADEIEIDTAFENGFATRFATRMSGNAVATASAAIRADGKVNSLEQVVYSACPVCAESTGEPTWSLRARRAVQNQNTQMISYQDAVLELKGVPIVYLPYFSHPDPTSKRRSGLLTPDLGPSSKLGFFYEQPYYWAISPSQDLVIAPMLSLNVAPLVKYDYRKRFFSGQLNAEGSFTHEKEFGSNGEKFGDRTTRSHLYADGLFNITNDWQWGFGLERQTDDLYDRRYDIDGEDDVHGLYLSQPRQLLSQLFVKGQTPDFYLETAALTFQGLREVDDDARFPVVAPTLFAEKVFDFGSFGRLATDASTAFLFRDTPATLPNGVVTKNSLRATLSADWRAHSVFGPGLVFEPFALARGDAFSLDDGTNERDVTRVLGLAGGQVSWPFMRVGENVDVVVEPLFMAAYGTDGANEDAIPNEDSLLFEADDSNILQPSAVSNYDLWEGGGRVAAGVSASAKFRQGLDLSGMIGRRWRDSADPAFTSLSNLSGSRSDYVASAKAGLGRSFELGARLRFDDAFDFERIDTNARINAWRLTGSARYYKIAQNQSGMADEGVAMRGSLKLTKNWSATYVQDRNIAEDFNTFRSIGLTYTDDCSYFSLAYERQDSRDRLLGPNESIRFRFVLTTLGGLGQEEFD